MNTPLTPRQTRALMALVWMALGLLLLCTPLAWPSRTLGYSAVYWLIGAPTFLLVALRSRAVPARARRAAVTDYPVTPRRLRSSRRTSSPRMRR